MTEILKIKDRAAKKDQDFKGTVVKITSVTMVAIVGIVAKILKGKN